MAVVFLPGWVRRVVPWFVGRVGRLWVRRKGEKNGNGEEAEETEAQIKAILGGIGIAIGCTFTGRAILRALIKFDNTNTHQPASWVLHSYPRVKGVGVCGWGKRIGV